MKALEFMLIIIIIIAFQRIQLTTSWKSPVTWEGTAALLHPPLDVQVNQNASNKDQPAKSKEKPPNPRLNYNHVIRGSILEYQNPLYHRESKA